MWQPDSFTPEDPNCTVLQLLLHTVLQPVLHCIAINSIAPQIATQHFMKLFCMFANDVATGQFYPRGGFHCTVLQPVLHTVLKSVLHCITITCSSNCYSTAWHFIKHVC